MPPASHIVCEYGVSMKILNTLKTLNTEYMSLVSGELGGACAPRRVCGGPGRRARRARRGGFAREDFFLILSTSWLGCGVVFT